MDLWYKKPYRYRAIHLTHLQTTNEIGKPEKQNSVCSQCVSNGDVEAELCNILFLPEGGAISLAVTVM